MKQFFKKHQFTLKWLGIALLIKLTLFIFFAVNFYINWASEVTNTIFVSSGDTSGYYYPLESFVQGNGYNSISRMPGLLPIYAPLRLLFSEMWAKTFMIILQFLTSTISVVVLAKVSLMAFKKERIFYITFFLYAFSSFVSIWDHVGYADSFSVSFLIFSIYFLLKYKSGKEWKYLVLSGFFITWSVFIRPMHGVVVPVVAFFYLIDFKNFILSVKSSFIYGLPLVICLSLWTWKNYTERHRIIILQGPIKECFPGITDELISIRELIIAWGGDTQHWSKGSDAEWLTIKSGFPEPESQGIYTKAYNLDSLKLLRNNFINCRNKDLSQEEKKRLKKYVNTKSLIYLESYKKEHFFKYIFTNKLILIKRLLLPKRLDNLPFPKLSEMNIIQKVTKGGYFILLIFINVFGIIGCLVALYRKILLPVIPLAFIFTLTIIFGYVEQRYLVPAYSFLVIFTAFILDIIIDKVKKLKSIRSS